MSPVEVYRAETDEIIRRFLQKQLTHDQCVVGLYDAFASALSDFSAEDWPRIRAVIAANNEALQAETENRRMDRHGSADPGHSRPM